LGIYGLFGFHFLLFLALRHAPPVQANLVNYLWPLLMVVLAPVFLPGMALRAVHLMAALLGFAGAAVVILGGAGTANLGGWAWGYVPAFPTAAIGGFALVSGLLSLLCHALLEPATALSLTDALLIGVMGLGPMGAAFFLWDKALKLGDARHIGILSYLTPLASTALLVSVSGRPFTAHIALAAAMIVGAALLGTRQR
jgi:drug/metabolite transporter (DMT)-like permease